MYSYLAGLLLSLAILVPGSFANSCRISATLATSSNNLVFYGGQAVMVDPTAGQKVTLRCHGSGREAIRYHQPMMGVKEYSLTSLELTAENFEPGIYRCRCASSIQGQLNISLPLAVTGEGRGQPRCMHIEVQKCIPQRPHVFAAPPNCMHSCSF